MSKALRSLALLIGIAAIATACSSDSESNQQSDRVVTVFGAYRAAEAEGFRQVLARFTEETGIATSYVGTAAFAERIRERVREGDLPDVALFPQPAILVDMARAGLLTPLEGALGARVRDGYSQGVAELATVDGTLYGAWFRLSLKSLVWYPPQVFAEQGYQIPPSWDELLLLTTQMRRDGFTPWCLGMEAFDATGWVGTDWIENIVLRLHGPEIYDQWTAGEIPFTDDRIRQAFTLFGEIALTPGQVAGGTRSILTVPAFRAIDPMFDEPAGCLLTRQTSSQVIELPSGIRTGPEGDVDVFVLPPIHGEEAPLLAAGEVAAAFSTSDEALALVSYLADPRSGEPWARLGGYNSPHQGFDITTHGNQFEAQLAELVRQADVVRFDGSDLMAVAVGTGTFWQGMIDYVAGVDLDSVLLNIQQGYGPLPP
ncbi:MAG: carbohydrate ABC transporter substrate-binding protein [Acidobacteria bacterium]|nr:carbohydrate ABC transporter substrate-binding protein [Acidobacteriota bacterium]